MKTPAESFHLSQFINDRGADVLSYMNFGAIEWKESDNTISSLFTRRSTKLH